MERVLKINTLSSSLELSLSRQQQQQLAHLCSPLSVPLCLPFVPLFVPIKQHLHMAALRTERSSRAAASTESADHTKRGRGRDHTALSHSLPLLLSQVASGMRPSGNAGHANGCWSRVFARRDSWVQHRLALLHFIEAQAARVGVVRVYVRVRISVHACVCWCVCAATTRF